MSVTVLPETVVTAKRDPTTGAGATTGNVATPDPIASAGVPPASAATPINDPSGPQSAIRQPLLKVIRDGGQALAGVVSAEIQNNSYYQCDHFTVTFAATAGDSPGWWDVEPPLVLDTHFSLDQGHSWTSLLIGEVDHMTMHFETGTIIMEGRDLSARLIETKTQEAFINQTSSQVIETLAARHGLTPVVTPTTTMVGRYYEADHVEGSLDQFARSTTEWDLAVYLAQREGFDVFVKGMELHFQPITPPNAAPFIVRWQPPGPIPRLNTTTLQAERSLTIAKDIEVWVRSWNSQQARAFTKKSRATGTRSATAGNTTTTHTSKDGTTTFGKGNTTQRYIFVRPNMTEEDAQALANQLAIDLTKHERILNVEMPGDLTLTPRDLVRLEGTGTSFDQSYYVEHITRSLAFGEGFRQTLRMKNSSPRSQVQVT